MVTMSDIAQRTGVTVTTVSNALTARGRVSEATRSRILAVADELGYEVNLTARHLRMGRSDTIALIVPSVHDYFGEIADELAVLAEATGRHLVLERTSALTESERAAITLQRLRMFDGVLLSAVGLDHDDVEQARRRVPLVVLGERPMPSTVDHVSLANEEGGRLATAHLLEHGARRVVVLGGSLAAEFGISHSRLAGWRQAHDAAGVPTDPRLVVPVQDYDVRHARAALTALIADGVPFDAVFAVTDMVALGAMSALAEHGLRVPQDVQVVGFDDLLFADFLVPRLTSVDPHSRELAATAMRLLEQRMSGDDAPPEHVVNPVSLVVRGSTRAG